MRRAWWLAGFLVALSACASTSAPVALITPSPSAAVASPSSAPSASTTRPSPSESPVPTPSAEPSPSPGCPATRGVPKFGPSIVGSRNLAIVRLQGSTKAVIRDVTDISHPATVASLNIPSAYPRFVGPNDVSWLWSDEYTNLFRTSIAGGTNIVVATCAALFDWSPDGTAAVYISSDGEKSALRQVVNGLDQKLADLPRFPAVDCESQGCADNWFFNIALSADGSLISLIESFGGPQTTFRIFKRDGTPVFDGGADSGATMAVWSGESLYFRDAQGVQVWRGGNTFSSVLPRVAWIYPKASPGGGQILFTVRDASGLPRVEILDTASSSVRQLSGGADRPAFLTSRYVWYEGIRLCGSSDQCPFTPVTPTGKTYVFDLQTGIASGSIITEVMDTWPHGA